MARVLVSLVSEQTLPNYLLLKEFQHKTDIFLFISTLEMEKRNKTNCIKATANLEKRRIRKVLVEENSLFQIKQRLDEAGYHTFENEYFVNLTGGTKLMSNAVYQYFEGLNSSFYYIPIGRNLFEEIFKDKPAIDFGFAYKLSVSEYLAIYGISYKDKKLAFSSEATQRVFDEYQKVSFTQESFPSHIANSLSNHYIRKDNIAGTWFEEFLYYAIKQSLDLSDQAINTGLKLLSAINPGNNLLNEHETDNEIDIVFLYNNNLFVVEAKVSLGLHRIKTEILNNAIYKLAALNKNFGLRARAFIFTFSDLSSLSQASLDNLKKRCDILNVGFPVDRSIISNKEWLKDTLYQLVS